MRNKSVVCLLVTFIASAFLLAACGQSDTGAVKINFAAFDQTKPQSLKSVSGLSSQEPFGIWSQEKTVVFEFDKPLPKKFNLSLKAYAFGPNASKNFKATTGSNAQNFTLPPDNPATKTVTLENSGRSKILTIEIPEPTSPSDLNLNSDVRKLGLAFYELNIQPL